MNWTYNKNSGDWYNHIYEIKKARNGVVIYKEGIYFKPAKSLHAAKKMLENN